jgi:fructokinase
LVEILSAADVSTQFFQVDDLCTTGLVYANANDRQEVVYDIVYPAAWDFIDWKKELYDLVERSAFFVYGSLTSRNRESRDTLYQCLQIAKTKVLDINIRPPHFNRPHVECLLESADILKMNEAELELITGWFSQLNSTEDRIRIVQERFDIDTVIVTMGGDGALVIDKGKNFRHPGFPVDVVDTIGSGDAFLAGFIYQVLQHKPVQEALEFASAIGAFIATQRGACPRYDPTQIEAMIASNSSPNLNIHV